VKFGILSFNEGAQVQQVPVSLPVSHPESVGAPLVICDLLQAAPWEATGTVCETAKVTSVQTSPRAAQIEWAARCD